MTKSAKFLVCLILFKLLLASTQDYKFTHRITGGYRPQKHTLVKHIVSIAKPGYDKFGVSHFCGGSIIYPRWILTAAHCLWNSDSDMKRHHSEFQIVAGTPNRLKKTEHTQVIDVIHVLIHPDYDNVTLKNDIGALILETDITLDDVYAQKIRLTDGPPKENQSCTALGWGTLFEAGPRPSDVLYVDINILSREVCKRKQPMYSDITDGQICAGDLSDVEKDTCSGDSGGPLICDGKLAGVVSFGDGCGENYGIYTDVWYHREKILKEWIFGCQDRITINLINILLLKLLMWILF